ncbi:gamma-glutamylcyclotransferase [Nodosilinea sp. LEGE 06152]|uniref:gamma-glutamylcyclotransferase family protein n=1 Tax=Nodosilinea sp. LEGE 06152 TaxID=2777966 RepID=UPI00187F3952|nr:gamma-glutamylcyclotransferase family protein [Nodosilinea sp. LEGE 06152]MBE9159661.1 gamma-glutamylcyclotransferase [Nodosilinea sp. LEGE 06152]
MNALCPLFVYGTLKPGERAFANFCAPYLVDSQPALAVGRLYHLPLGYPAMTLETGWVQGMLLTFSSPDCLRSIDAFEEYYPDRPESSEYQRDRHLVFDLQHQPLGTAWVYTMTRDRVTALAGQWLPQGHWSETTVP